MPMDIIVVYFIGFCLSMVAEKIVELHVHEHNTLLYMLLMIRMRAYTWSIGARPKQNAFYL